MKFAIVIFLLSLILIAGCSERKTQIPVRQANEDCKFLYERKVEGDATSQPQIGKQDHIVIFFSAQSTRIIGYNHNFAVFAKVRSDKAEEAVTISWMPKSMNKTRGLSEPGINLDIPTTLAWAKANNAIVERHGPYYITETLYARAKAQVEKLHDGTVQFKLLDQNMRPDIATNSVHAISDITCNGDKFDKFLIQTGTGRDASAVLKVYFEREGFLDGKYKNDRDLAKQFDIVGIRRLD
jgi:hypothetical protein